MRGGSDRGYGYDERDYYNDDRGYGSDDRQGSTDRYYDDDRYGSRENDRYNDDYYGDDRDYAPSVSRPLLNIQILHHMNKRNSFYMLQNVEKIIVFITIEKGKCT